MAEGTPSTDEDLLLAAGRGEAGAFEELYRRHRQWVMNYAAQLTGDRDAAADVLQETFRYIHQKAPEYRPLAKFTTFLFRIVRHNALKSKRKMRPLPMGELPAESAVTRARPEDALVARERGEAVQKALATLQEIHREVIYLRIIASVPTNEVAAVLGIPEGTVKSRLHNGLELLRRGRLREEVG